MEPKTIIALILLGVLVVGVIFLQVRKKNKHDD